MSPVLLKCQCCGYEEAFQSADDAFAAGWDCPPMFSSHVACPLCPGVCALGLVPHDKAHALWKQEGRPDTFSLEKCSGDNVIDNPSELRKAQQGMRKISAIFKQLRRKAKEL